MSAQRQRTEKPCDAAGCKGTAYKERRCAAYVCDTCRNHIGLVRCWCGWAASGGNGRRELEEFGEVIDDDDY